MNDPLIDRFAEACGAAGPLNLRVDLAADGGLLAEGSVQQPFTLVGRDDACDVTLTDPEVNLRHTWLQVVAGRVYAVDLGSRTGLVWPDGRVRSGWLDVGIPVRLGPFRVHLRTTPSPRPAAFATDYDPLHADPAIARIRPAVCLDFRNGRRDKDQWAVNRLITLVGRSETCKIHLNADDIAGYHCGLVLTPVGLWVVDLSGRGVVVNGERMRVAPLGHGAELWVGRFLIGCHYPGSGATPAAGRPGLLTPPNPLPGLSPPTSRPPTTPPPRAPKQHPVIPEDEVPLGIQPPTDPAAGLPSSHIMADAFRVLTGLGPNGGPISNPILVSGSNPTPASVPVPPNRTDPPAAAITPPAPRSEPQGPAGAETAVVAMLRQVGEIHGQIFDQFQQSLLLMMQVFGQMHREQMTAMQQELTRIHDLNAELGRLESEVARLAVARAAGRKRAEPATPLDQWETVPILEMPPVVKQGPDSGTAIQAWVVERITALQQERQASWDKLVGHFADSGDRPA